MVVDLRAEDTYDLRRTVLRNHWPDKNVDYETDHWPGSFHLGIRDAQGRVVAIASFVVEEATERPGRSAVRILGMAVDPAEQGARHGRTIVEEALRRLRREGVHVCWANARSTALGFYRKLGFVPVGEEFEHVAVAHQRVVLDLGP